MYDTDDMSKIFDKFKEITKNAKQEVENLVFKASAGGGLVDISINGHNEIIELNIDDELLNDKDSLQILLISVINDVLNQSKTNQQTQAMNMFNDITKSK